VPTGGATGFVRNITLINIIDRMREAGKLPDLPEECASNEKFDFLDSAMRQSILHDLIYLIYNSS
jgi:hypothetical protein